MFDNGHATNVGHPIWDAIIAQLTPSLFISAMALTLSVVTIYLGYRNRRRDVPFDVIPKSYERYYDMNRIELQYPHLTHLFVTYDKYQQIKSLVVQSTHDLDNEKRSAYLLQERAVVDLLMSYYEQILYQWESTGDKEREFVASIIKYFEGRLLRNPRVIWWWQADCGGLETSYEDDTRKRWKKNVLAPISGGDVSEWRDDYGPFGQPPSPSQD